MQGNKARATCKDKRGIHEKNKRAKCPLSVAPHPILEIKLEASFGSVVQVFYWDVPPTLTRQCKVSVSTKLVSNLYSWLLLLQQNTDKSNSLSKTFILAHSWRYSQKVMSARAQSSGHTVFVVRELRVVNAGAQLVFSCSQIGAPSPWDDAAHV